MMLGIAVIFMSGLSGWSIGRSMVATGLWSDRFGFAGTTGACLILIALFELLVENHHHRAVLICSLLGLAIGFHLRNANEYRWSTIKQTRFYWQLALRAPQIEPGTAILSDGEIFPKMGVYLSFAINLLYPLTVDASKLNYWFYSLNKYFENRTDELVEGIALSGGHWHLEFSGMSKDSLVMHYEPERGGCLWVLDSQDMGYPIPEITKKVLSLSNLGRITSTEAIDGFPPQDIFGAEPDLGWCNYYQKASLARQQKDWKRITKLWEEASQKGQSPNQPVELLPFIMGYAHIGDWDTALELTHTSYTGTGLNHFLCPAWKAILADTKATPQREALFNRCRQC